MILKKPLGQIMAKMGFITRQQLNEALQRQKRIIGEKPLPEQMQRVRLVSEARRSLGTDKAPLLGEILADMGFATKEQLEEALGEQDKSFEVYKSLEKEKLGIAIETGSLLNSTLNLAEVLDLIMRHANQVTNSVASTLMLIDDKTEELVFSIPTGPKADKLTDIRIPRGKGIAGWVAEHKQPVLIPNAQDDSRFYPEMDKISGLETKAILCVPLKAKTRLIGVLEAINKVDGTSFTEEDIQLLNIFGHQAAVAIENARLHSELTDRLEERKEAEEALRESEEKYRNILESIKEGYYETDIAGNFAFLNESFCSISGYSKDELMGASYRQYTNPKNIQRVYETFNKVYITGEPIEGFGWEIMRKDGGIRYIEVSVSLKRDSEGHRVGFRGIVRDITGLKRAEKERKRLEARLQQAQKMEAIATLAGGIAHQFNNALSSITGYTGLLEMKFSDNEKIMDYVKPMKESAHRMAHLTSQLLSYARGGRYNPQTMLLSEYVKGTLPLIRHTLDPAIRLETDLPPDILNVEADRTQMQMVLSALMANANEAIEVPGRVRITTKNVEVDQDFIKDPGLTPGRYVCLSIEDDGKGMDEETRSRIFEPFFTTHFMGRGLGMASVYGIVTNHGGAITVDSELGKGTVVRIYLPAISAGRKEHGAKVVKTPEVELPTGEGTVLVIEDEEPLVKLFRLILERLGYRVVQARTGKEGVEIAKTFDGDIDLALLDIKLPDMEGGRVYPLIMEARPNLKVLVCSGYALDGPAQGILDAGAEGVIQKPFSIAELAEKLKEVLER